MSETTTELLTIREAAAVLRVSVEQVRLLCAKGALGFIVVSLPKAKKVQRRIRRDTLQEFISREQRSDPERVTKQLNAAKQLVASAPAVW